MTDNTTNALLEHYQKTYELTYLLWQQRNRAFLTLMAVIGLAALLTFQTVQPAPKNQTDQPPTASQTTQSSSGAAPRNPILINFIAKYVGLTEKEDVEALVAGFQVQFINAIVLAIIFYLVVNLNHRALYVLRNYRYLSHLEHDIRNRLGLKSSKSIAFTREGEFYWRDRSPLSGTVKWVYIGLVGLVLTAFLGIRLYLDFIAAHAEKTLWAAFAVDCVLTIAISAYYFEYAWMSVTQDTEEAEAIGSS